MDQISKRNRVKCCVIGGAGFIGTHVSRILLEAGRDVLVLGRRLQPDNSLASKVTYVSGDYGSRAVLKNLFVGVAEVIDLAYSTVPQTSFADPVYDILSNLPASVGLLQEAAAADIRKVVLVATSI